MLGLGLAEWLIVLPFLAAYPLPTIVAWARGHDNRRAITAVNLLLGWTGIGWVVAMVWAFVGAGRARALTVLLIASLLAGCATSLAELRAAEPYRTEVLAGDLRALALCTLDGANSLPRGHLFALPSAGGATYQLVDYRPAPRIAVIGYSPSGSADVELTFAEAAASRVRIELRFGFSDEGGQRRYADGLWPIVERCSAAAAG